MDPLKLERAAGVETRGEPGSRSGDGGRKPSKRLRIAVALLGVATVIRLVEDVRAPEGYTLPAAALLLGAGWWRLGTDRELSSGRALSSGLTLALVPSLLLALDDPVTVRGALVAAGGLVALAVGVARHWAAPFVAGAGTTAVLAVRHLGPYESPGFIAAATEFVLEGLHLHQKLNRDSEGARWSYRA